MLGYRAFFHVENVQDLLPRASAQLHSWLRSKRYDADRLERAGLQTLADHVTGVLLEESGQDGSQSFRARVMEDRPGNGRWNTELTVHRSGRRGDGWVWLDVHCPDEASWTATPRLARGLLDVLPARDGSLSLSTSPTRLGEEDVDALVVALMGQGRRGLAFVAGSHPDLPLAPWSDYVGGLLKQTNGLASGYVLDPAATARFSEVVGPHHEVTPATIRTFQPGVAVDDPANALRHRILGTERILRDSTGHLGRVLGARARELSLALPLPSDAQRLDRRLRAIFDEQLVADARPARTSLALLTEAPRPVADALDDAGSRTSVPPPVERRHDDQEALRAEFGALMADLTGSASLTVESLHVLRERISAAERVEIALDAAVDQLQARIHDLENERDKEVRELQDANHLYESMVIEHAEAEEARATSDLQVRSLQKQLARTDTTGDIWTAPQVEPRDVPPSDMQDLLDRLSAGDLLRHVVFTGEADPSLYIDERDHLGRVARKAWDALQALDDYADESAAGRCDRDVDGYLEDTPPGCHRYSAARHARSESQDVQNNPKFGDKRFFRVPAAVHPSEKIAMYAHFKLAQVGLLSPRLHYWDDTPRTGKVYVGAHLPTQKSN